MKTVEMRTRHDLTPEWIYQDVNGVEPFSRGSIRMDRADIARAMDLVYQVMGWDKATGAPTAQAYARLGLQEVAKRLAEKNVLPEGKS